jgi:hypothetical protein
MSRSLVSIGKGLEAESQSHDDGSPGGVRGGDKRQASGSGTSKKSPLGKLDSTVCIGGALPVNK